MNYQRIQLKGGAYVLLDLDAKRVACRKCKKLIRFAITEKRGKKIPIEEAGEKFVAHFATCEFANDFRKNSQENKIEEENKNQEYLNDL